jgi:hypothetical protein
MNPLSDEQPCLRDLDVFYAIALSPGQGRGLFHTASRRDEVLPSPAIYCWEKIVFDRHSPEGTAEKLLRE